METWRAIRETAIEQTKVIGHRWSAPSYQARDFLARNAVPYRWYSVDDPEGQRLLDATGVTAADIPVVITADAGPSGNPATRRSPPRSGCPPSRRRPSTT